MTFSPSSTSPADRIRIIEDAVDDITVQLTLLQDLALDAPTKYCCSLAWSSFESLELAMQMLRNQVHNEFGSTPARSPQKT